jgi:hypothetical protein
LWRVRPSPERKRTAQRGGAGNVEALAPTTTDGIDRSLSSVARDERTKGGRGSGWQGEGNNRNNQEK